ncbi:hypothetical protein B566_EDAN016468 [Ephemera danica]|nr:hypothetical protein B566_EDAN016468 [Ephemera danica]
MHDDCYECNKDRGKVVPESVTCSKKHHDMYIASMRNAEKNLSREECRRRIASQLWDMDSFDPFQLFEVVHKKCSILHVHVVRGVDVTKGWIGDLVDVPDPYLIVSVPGTPNSKKKTSTVNNTPRPVWNEHFEFYLDPAESFKLELILMDANFTVDDQLGQLLIDLDGLKLDQEVEKAANFENGSKILLRLKITENETPDLRYSLALSEEERKYLRERREKVPVIGLLGSGGGFRAMIALSGVLQALYDEGVMDTVIYMAGLSGSSWYLSYLYSHPDYPTKSLRKINEELKSQPISFTDLFGHLVADVLLGSERKESTLSQQRRCLENAEAPLPLYTCLNVKYDVSAKVFQDWIEFSPFEIGIPKYGVFIPAENFSSKFYVGKLIKQCPECPLHFLQGVWGNAFSEVVRDLLIKHCNCNVQPVETDDSAECCASLDDDEEEDANSSEDENEMGENATETAKHDESCDCPVSKFMMRAGRVYNPLRGLNIQNCYSVSPWYISPVTPTTAEDVVDFKGFYEATASSAKSMYLVDSGLNFNLPYPLLLRPQRAVDLFLSFEFSAREKDDTTPFSKEELRELYVFEDEEDESCPVILHFVLINKAFRQFKAPGVPRTTKEEKQFANFDIFYDQSPYSSTNFHYKSEHFDRLNQLAEFNVRYTMPEIKEELAKAVKKKQRLLHKPLAMNMKKVKKLVKALSVKELQEPAGEDKS